MIDPHVEQGGASSWFRMAAKLEPDFAAKDTKEGEGFEGAEGAEGPEGAEAAVALTSSGNCSGVETTSSRLLTPARNCASGDRNFAASQRKM